jgi:transposase-like protein
VVTLLRQIEVAVANGKTTPQACKEAEITEQTYYRWRKEYGGLKLDQARRVKELEKENARLKRVDDGAAAVGRSLDLRRRARTAAHARPAFRAANPALRILDDEGRPLAGRDIALAPGPGASKRTRARYGRA